MRILAERCVTGPSLTVVPSETHRLNRFKQCWRLCRFRAIRLIIYFLYRLFCTQGHGWKYAYGQDSGRNCPYVQEMGRVTRRSSPERNNTTAASHINWYHRVSDDSENHVYCLSNHSIYNAIYSCTTASPEQRRSGHEKTHRCMVIEYIYPTVVQMPQETRRTLQISGNVHILNCLSYRPRSSV